MTLPDEYQDLTADELSEEIKNTDELIEIWQKSIAITRKKLNRAMELREDLIDRQKELLGRRKGWNNHDNV